MNLVFQLKVLQLLISTSNFLFMARTKDGGFPPTPNLSAFCLFFLKKSI